MNKRLRKKPHPENQWRIALVIVFFLITLSVKAQERIQISGTVVSETNDPLPGVNILIKGTVNGTTTDSKGQYTLSADANAILVFSFIGYAPSEHSINNQTVINVSLSPDLTSLSEVVVVGYGTQKRADITGALSSVSSKDFSGQPVTRVDQALQGRVAGVQITNAGGAPGGDVRIRVRGSNSLSGDNDPLYVIDGFVGGDFTTINPNDIASIEVLKDASSTAIYGSRGANGVVIITTRSGKKDGSIQVEFGARYYSSQLIKRYNTMNAADFATVANERALALTPEGGTYTPRFTDAEVAAFKTNGGTDWQKEIFRTAPGKEYQLGVSGGSEKTTFLISGNYLDQDGIIRNSDFKRYSVRTNINTAVSKKFSVRLNFTGTRKENHNTGGTGQRGGSLAQALAWAPTTPVRDAAGNYTFKDPTSSLFANPVAINNENDYRVENTNANLVGGLKYEFIPGLSFDSQFGVNYSNQQVKSFSGVPATLNVAVAGRSSSENSTLQNINTLNYNHVFNSVHRIDVTAVVEEQKFVGTGFSVNVNNLTYPSQSYNNLALSGSSNVNSGYSSWSLFSMLGRVNYSFRERYLLSATIRRDGSSKFQGNNKYSTFPSLAAGWRISEEAFMQNITAINDLKLRGSWGMTGNQGIAPYGTLSQYSTNIDDAGVVFNGPATITTGIILGNPGNPNLKWETTEQFDIGADLEILQGRVTLTADYFVKNTKNLLMLRGLPGYIGGYSIQSNIGKIENKGVELALGFVPVRSGDFEWSSSFNTTFLKNKVVDLGTERDTIPLNENVLIPGHSMNSFWGYHFLGTWKPADAQEAMAYGAKPGDARYEDVNKDGFINEKDYQIIGSGMPEVSIGWNNTFTYKNLSLNVFFQGLLGFDKLNYSYANGMLSSSDAKEITFADIKGRYIPGVNETSDIPAFSSTGSNNYTQSSRFIQKGDFVRLKNISLTYSIPKATLKNITAIKVFVSVTNLLTFTKYKGIDPEANSSAVSGLTWQNYNTDVQQGIDYGAYPNSKTFTMGINFTF